LAYEVGGNNARQIFVYCVNTPTNVLGLALLLAFFALDHQDFMAMRPK
jgi:hypothetical protein